MLLQGEPSIAEPPSKRMESAFALTANHRVFFNTIGQKEMPLLPREVEATLPRMLRDPTRCVV